MRNTKIGGDKNERKKIKKERFLYLKDNIDVLNIMVHLPENEQTLVENDAKLTEEIELLRIAVRRFEKETNICIEVY
jgi:hypothetical protein